MVFSMLNAQEVSVIIIIAMHIYILYILQPSNIIFTRLQ